MASLVASKSGPSAKTLKGPDKGAALFLCMGKPLAARLLKQFDHEELRQITRSIAELGTVPVPMVEVVVEEFASQFANGGLVGFSRRGRANAGWCPASRTDR
jgi:flagellar motor switch protein FliG